MTTVPDPLDRPTDSRLGGSRTRFSALSAPGYSGPVVDSHLHLWDLGMDAHPWLRPAGGLGLGGRLDALKRCSYLPGDYATDITATTVTASVHVEALWDPRLGHAQETAWLESLELTAPLPTRYVAGVPFGVPATSAIVAEQASCSKVKAVRQTIAWTPDPNRRIAQGPHVTEDGSWRVGVDALRHHGLALELLMYPEQAADVERLATDRPDLTIIVDHLGSPDTSTPQGLGRWREAIERLGQHPSVVIKASAVASYLAADELSAGHGLIDHVVHHFGSRRVMFGSDYPVERLTVPSYAANLALYRRWLADRSFEEQLDVFARTAARVYDLDWGSSTLSATATVDIPYG